MRNALSLPPRPLRGVNPACFRVAWGGGGLSPEEGGSPVTPITGPTRPTRTSHPFLRLDTRSQLSPGHAAPFPPQGAPPPSGCCPVSAGVAPL